MFVNTKLNDFLDTLGSDIGSVVSRRSGGLCVHTLRVALGQWSVRAGLLGRWADAFGTLSFSGPASVSGGQELYCVSAFVGAKRSANVFCAFRYEIQTSDFHENTVYAATFRKFVFSRQCFRSLWARENPLQTSFRRWSGQ